MRYANNGVCAITVFALLMWTMAVASSEPLQVAGTINRDFNPLGVSVTGNGALITGPLFFSGSLVVNLGGNEAGSAVAINQNNGKVISACLTNVVPEGTNGIAIVVTNSDGTLDGTFNPSGLAIDSNGNFTASGGFSGVLVISTPNERSFAGRKIALDQDSGNIVVVSSLRVGVNPVIRDLWVVVLKPDGSLERTFNPSGVFVDQMGLLATGPDSYSGALQLSLRRNESSPTVVIDQNRSKIAVALATEAGKPNFQFNLGLIVINPTGFEVLDRNFNPSGFMITSTGARVIQANAGYPGALVIDLDDNEVFIPGDNPVPTLDIEQESGKLVAAMGVNTGPGVLNNIGVVVALPTGPELLDTSFNPQGFALQADGSFTAFGGYSGAMIIDLGGDEQIPSLKVDQDSENIIFAARTTTGPIANSNLALVILTPTGLLDTSFNPSGAWIDEDSNLVPGGIPGVLIANFGPGVVSAVNSIAQVIARDIGVLVPTTILGTVSPRRLRALAIDSASPSILRREFNPSGLFVQLNGSVVPNTLYSGSFGAELEIFSQSIDVDVYQSDGTIGISLQRGDPTHPDPRPDLQLFSFHGRTIFPPPPPLPPLSPLFNLPFIPAGAA